MTTSMMMYPVFQPQHELPHQHFLTAATATAAPTPVMHTTQHHHHNAYMHHRTGATAPAPLLVPTVPEELRCQYSSKRCENHRTNKKSGGLHKFCAVHREKANRNQMRLDHRRRVLKRLAQRNAQNGSPTSSSTSSPYTKKRSSSRGGEHDTHDEDDFGSVLSVEDNLEIDLMPLALHRENNPTTSIRASDAKPLFDPQDLHILETLLFSDEDQTTETDGHASPASKSRKTPKRAPQPKKQKLTATVPAVVVVKTEEDDFAGWLLNL